MIRSPIVPARDLMPRPVRDPMARIEYKVDWMVDAARRAYELEQYLMREFAKLKPWSRDWWRAVKELDRVRVERIALRSVQPFRENE